MTMCSLHAETPNVRQAWLQQDRQKHLRQRDVNPDIPLFEQPAVDFKVLNFHSKLVSLEFHTCISCLERFPNLPMASNGTECAHCGRDK